MSARLTLALCATVALIGLAGGARTSFAQSDQPAATGGGGGLEEIVVTARRREEKAQTVPITLLTFQPAALEKKDIRDPLKLTDSIPGFNGATGGSLGLTYTFLRGAPGVIFYWDDVPINVNNQAVGFYFDMQNLQVLYGPQGTLFGLSNDAGAILFQPNHPKNDYDGYGKITLGDYGRQTVEAVVNVPVVADKLLLRAGVQYQKQDGYQHVIKQNIDLLNQNYWNFRFAGTYNATDNLRNEFMLNYFDTQYLPGSYTFVAANPGPAQAFGSLSLQQILNFAQQGLVGPFAQSNLAGKNIDLVALQKQQEALGRYTLAGLSLNPTAVLKQLNIVNTTSWDINDNLTLKNIAAYAQIYNYSLADIGGLEFGLLQGPIPSGFHDQPRGPTVQYNEEIQLIGNFFDNKLRFQAGFFNQWGGATSGAGGSTPSNSTAPYGIQYTNNFGGVSVTGATLNQQSRTDAVYGQATYDFSDYVEGVSFTGGFRYNWDKFYTRGDSYSYVPNLRVDPSGNTGIFKLNPPTCRRDNQQFFGANNCATSQSARFTSPSYTVQINYQWRPATMFYFNNSLGYKTGGFNGQNLVDFQIFKPEHLNNYEVGVKTDFDLAAVGLPDVKSRFNGSMYYGVYRGIEIQTTGAYLTPAGNLSLGTPYLDVGDGDLYGWDIQWTVIPWEDLTLQLNAEYNRGKYKNFQGPNPARATDPAAPPQISVPGVGFEILPQYKFDGTATYHLPFIDKAYGDVSITGSYSWVQHSLASDVAQVGFGDVLPGHHNVDINVAWDDIWGRTGLSGQFFVTNVTNNSIVNGCLCAYRAIGEIGLQPAQPRMFGFSLKYAFQSDTLGGETPPAPYTPPAPQAVAPAPRSYLVFFDFNKSDLTPQAMQIVDEAAKNAGPAKVTRLTVTGHTDTVGSDAYNMRLSRRRAESVAAELEKDGIPSSEIEIVAKGKRDLLVPTADGVREPQNRRVQIVYDGGPTM
jgi:iron complex outermembrane receptor protein